jgi:hypothetical protein
MHMFYLTRLSAVSHRYEVQTLAITGLSIHAHRIRGYSPLPSLALAGSGRGWVGHKCLFQPVDSYWLRGFSRVDGNTTLRAGSCGISGILNASYCIGFRCIEASYYLQIWPI